MPMLLLGYPLVLKKMSANPVQRFGQLTYIQIYIHEKRALLQPVLASAVCPKA